MATQGFVSARRQAIENRDNPPPAEPNLNELLLQQQQEEADYNAMLRPIMLQQMGLIEDKDAEGKAYLRPMTEDEKIAIMTPEQKQAYELDKLAADEQLKYAQGRGETPAAIQNVLDTQKRTQQGLLNQRLGARGSRLSTPGIESASDIAANELGVKSAYAYGNEAQGMGLINQNAQNLFNQAQSWNNNASGLLSGTNLPNYGILSQQSSLAQKNLYDLQDTMAQQRSNAAITGLMNAAGAAGSMYLTRGMGR